MNQANFDRVIKLLEKSGADIDFRYQLKDKDFETAEDIRDILEDAGEFNQEIIYYSNAIKYLQENDPSLRDSLEIAEEFGYEVKNLSSEILASLLASKLTREAFEEIFSDLEDLLNEISEEEEECS